MRDSITAGQVVKDIQANVLNNDRGMRSMWVNNVLVKLNIGQLQALEKAIQKAKDQKTKQEATALVRKMKNIGIDEERLLRLYRDS